MQQIKQPLEDRVIISRRSLRRIIDRERSIISHEKSGYEKCLNYVMLTCSSNPGGTFPPRGWCGRFDDTSKKLGKYEVLGIPLDSSYKKLLGILHQYDFYWNHITCN